jgi:hypothetical protein
MRGLCAGISEMSTRLDPISPILPQSRWPQGRPPQLGGTVRTGRRGRLETAGAMRQPVAWRQAHRRTRPDIDANNLRPALSIALKIDG